MVITSVDGVVSPSGSSEDVRTGPFAVRLARESKLGEPLTGPSFPQRGNEGVASLFAKQTCERP